MLHGHRKIRKHGDEHVIDGERVLDHVTGKKLERGVASELGVIHADEVGAVRRLVKQELVSAVIEGEHQQNEDHAADDRRVRRRQAPGLAEDAEDEGQNGQQGGAEADIGPPVLGER